MGKCIVPGCTVKDAVYGKGGSNIAEYCKKHAPIGYIDIKSKLCIASNCTIRPTYGKIGTKIADYCKKHAPVSYVDVCNKSCLEHNCTVRPNFGKLGSNIAYYCKTHAPVDYVDVKNKICVATDCTTRSTYSKKDSKLVEYCKMHAPIDYVNAKNKTCIAENCRTQPIYGKIGSTIADYCKTHAPTDYVDVKNKTCKSPNCTTLPSYGKIGSKVKDYCKMHAPVGYVNVKSKKCIAPECATIPVYGQHGSKIANYCKQHAPAGCVDVINKICIVPDCSTRSNYGKVGSKIATYCRAHAPIEYVNVKNSTCVISGCDTRPNYNYIGYSPEYCGIHKQPGMIIFPIKRCSICKKIATHKDITSFYCETHKSADADELTNLCSICLLKTDLNQKICDSCSTTMKDGKTIKRKLKELEVKQYFENNGIKICSYDKTIQGGCSKKRPDFIIEQGGVTIVIEVDEFQHQRSSYTCSCEITRMKEIYFDLGIENGKVLFIRYNPDKYIPSYGKEFTAVQRLEYLLKYVTSFSEDMMDVGLKVLYLFYDGFTQLTNEIDVIDLYSVPKPIPTVIKIIPRK